MFSNQTETIANAANMLVNIAAFAADPSGITAIGTAANSVLSLQAIFKAPNVAKQLTDHTTKSLRDALTPPAFTPDQCQLLPQMLEAALPTPTDFAQKNLNPDAILALMTARLTDFEHCKLENAQAFTNWLRPALTQLLNDPTFTTTLAPQIAAETLARLQEIAENLLSLSQTYQTLAKSLDHLAELRQKDLEALAFRFGLTPPRNAEPKALLKMLEGQAEQMHAYQAQIDQINPKAPGLHNLKAAIQDAASRLDFAEVERLIARVDEVETEINASTKELRASNFLKLNRPDDAYRHFRAAAESFAAIDPTEVTARRHTYADSFYYHGIRYGGSGLLRAIDLLRANLQDLSQTENPTDWAKTQINLANAFVAQAARTEGTAGAGLLADAVVAYYAALRIYTRTAHPTVWAAAQNNLAIALRNQAARTKGAAGEALLTDAVTACRAALQVRTFMDHPTDWAKTQNNLANTLSDRAARHDGPMGTALLADAITAYSETLGVFTIEDHPIHWATTKNNMAAALANLAARTEGTEGASLLASAIVAFRDTLLVRTRSDHPIDWAITKNNLGRALTDKADRTEGAEGVNLLTEAVDSYHEALQIRTSADHPADWAMTQSNLAGALFAQAARTEGTAAAALLKDSVTAFRNALQVYASDTHPIHWAKTMENLAIVYLDIAGHPSTTAPEPALREALAAVDAALTVYDPIHMAPDYARATALRAQILTTLKG